MATGVSIGIASGAQPRPRMSPTRGNEPAPPAAMMRAASCGVPLMSDARAPLPHRGEEGPARRDGRVRVGAGGETLTRLASLATLSRGCGRGALARSSRGPQRSFTNGIPLAFGAWRRPNEAGEQQHGQQVGQGLDGLHRDLVEMAG